MMYSERMETKNTQIKIKAGSREKKRWQAALSEDGRTMSDVFRRYMDKYAARIERRTASK